MSPRLTITSLVSERLKKLPEGSVGNLFGISDAEKILVIGFTLLSPKGDGEEVKDSVDIVLNLPSDIRLCGVFKISAEEVTSCAVKNVFLEDISGIPVILGLNTSSLEITAYLYDNYDSLKKINYTIVNTNEISQSLLCLRITASVPLTCDLGYENILESFSFIKKKVASGDAAFHFKGSDVYIFGNSADDISGISGDSTIDELYSVIQQSLENKKKSTFEILNVDLLLKSTNNETSSQLAPVIKYVKKVYKHVGIQLPLDALAVTSKQRKIKDLNEILTESISRNLKLNEENILNQLKLSNHGNIYLPQTYHFLLKPCEHFLSLVYSVKATVDELKSTRETFHSLLVLPMDKPLLRKSNAFDFSNVQSNTNCLINPHEGLGSSGVPDGEPCFVQGKYAYHHYMQDKFDDNGWGCAYRSLQTVFSWFRFQGYTNIPIPSHRDIQQCLVNIGDKPQTFVGSKQWIGSTEVSFVLDTMLGVTCRILSVSSGEEMQMKGGELSYHFKTQGTPVMIGGGVLAHTIIGVDYNKKTGAIRFLILDPHYTGGEDLKVIQAKGWCGWKGPEFWKKDAFYNMCLPIRPKCV